MLLTTKKRHLLAAEAGFSLLEIMIALSIFAVFITAYLTSEGYKVADSTLMTKEIILHKLCQEKLTEVLLNPPPLEESLTLVPKQGNFEEQGYPHYEYKIEYKRLKLPDLNQIEGTGDADVRNDDQDGNFGGEGENSASAQRSAALEKQIFNMMKKNMEDFLWQVQVTVNEKGTQFPYKLTTLITNPRARVNTGMY